jgi:hypothetical protein
MDKPEEKKEGGQEILPAFDCARLLTPSFLFSVIFRKRRAIAAAHWPWEC